MKWLFLAVVMAAMCGCETAEERRSRLDEERRKTED